MALIPVHSSAIRAIGYDGYTLAVLFHTSDTVYEHRGVPARVVQEFLRASSMGAYYNQHIRGRFR